MTIVMIAVSAWMVLSVPAALLAGRVLRDRGDHLPSASWTSKDDDAVAELLSSAGSR